MGYTLRELDEKLDRGIKVFEHYYEVETGKQFGDRGLKMRSPFLRAKGLEENPSFSVYLHSEKGTWFFKDQATGLYGTHWTFVMKLYPTLDFKKAVEKVKQDILGIREGGATTPIITARPVKYATLESKYKSEVVITPGYRDWNDDDLKFFKGAGISQSTLELFDCAPASHYDYARENKVFRISAKENSPMYIFDFNECRRKVYQPFSPDSRYKWTSNLSADKDIFGFKAMPEKADHLFLLAGNRDTMSFYENIGYPAMALASESTNLPVDFRQWIERHYTNIWVLYDNDKQGIRKAEQFEMEYGYKSLNWIYTRFDGSNEDGKANDFVDFYQCNKNRMAEFAFLLEEHINNVHTV